jgi:hypothetical protein
MRAFFLHGNGVLFTLGACAPVGFEGEARALGGLKRHPVPTLCEGPMDANVGSHPDQSPSHFGDQIGCSIHSYDDQRTFLGTSNIFRQLAT